jgi:peptidoglycan/LPS O-acetylase OafA/YrhL
MNGETAQSATARFAGIDGLRAIAAGSVLVYHVWRFGDPGGGSPDLGPLSPVMPHLWHGVTLFFVLSGFLLYRPFAAAAMRRAPQPGIGRYLRHRALRILPAYWFVLAVTAFGLEAALVAGDAGPRTEGRPNAELLVVNLLLLQNASPDTIFTGIGPAWSLTVEAGFYLVLPLLALLAVALEANVLPPRLQGRTGAPRTSVGRIPSPCSPGDRAPPPWCSSRACTTWCSTRVSSGCPVFRVVNAGLASLDP